MSFYLDEKIKNIFPEESIYKMPGGYSYFSGLNLPSFIKDWLIKKFTNVNDEVDEEGLNHFLEEHLPGKDSNITGNLIQGHTITILARIIVEVNIASGEYRFGLPDLGIKTKDGKISKAVIRANPNLGEGEFWGIVTLEYRERDEEKVLSRGYIEMTGGIKFISLEDIPLKLKCILTVMILSFGGLSVHMQIMGILNDTDINREVKRAKALIVNSNDEVMLVFSHNTYFLVGGHVEENESY